MTKTEILDDIEYVTALAVEGRNAPYLGGRIGLMWGVLLCVTLLIHWATLTGHLAFPQSSLGILWIVYGVVGFVLSGILNRGTPAKPGQSSMNNKVANALWVGNAIFLSIYAMSAGLSAGFGGNDFIIMDTILPLAFGLYGFIHYVLARISAEKWQYVSSAVSLGFVPICLFLQGEANLYLASVVGIIATIIVPSLLYIKREPHDVI
ncbi:MAG: hypothetical protein COA69_12245 [Robiginitomaculum sp.]|nr:MAG: hypothetical protein COA69_12245 [Robiginitomaculum sp.]